MTRGLFFSFEGIDYCGKTTQISMLENCLKNNGLQVVVAREPGGTALGETLRRVLKFPREVYELFNQHYKNEAGFKLLPIDQERTAEAEMLMFMAARADFIHHVVNPSLNNGINVIADRLGDSTRAYQGGGRYDSMQSAVNLINMLNNFVLGTSWPDKTFFLDIDYDVMIERAKAKGNAKLDYIESSGRRFFERTIREYREIAKEDKARVVLIDGTKSIEEIFNQDILPVAKLFVSSRYKIDLE